MICLRIGQWVVQPARRGLLARVVFGKREGSTKVFSRRGKLERKILPLEEFIEGRRRADPWVLFEEGSQEMLRFGTDPLRLRH
jgi:hypothetical protein